MPRATDEYCKGLKTKHRPQGNRPLWRNEPGLRLESDTQQTRRRIPPVRRNLRPCRKNSTTTAYCNRNDSVFGTAAANRDGRRHRKTHRPAPFPERSPMNPLDDFSHRESSHREPVCRIRDYRPPFAHRGLHAKRRASRDATVRKTRRGVCTGNVVPGEAKIPPAPYEAFPWRLSVEAIHGPRPGVSGGPPCRQDRRRRRCRRRHRCFP